MKRGTHRIKLKLKITATSKRKLRMMSKKDRKKMSAFIRMLIDREWTRRQVRAHD